LNKSFKKTHCLNKSFKRPPHCLKNPLKNTTLSEQIL
jgi:hypothetical protein